MKYNQKLQAYVIDEGELSLYSIDYLNRFSNRLLIDVDSTKRLNREFVEKLNNKHIRIRIRGGYDEKRASYWNKKNESNNNIRKGKFEISGVSYYEDANIYTVKEVNDIIKELEKIESGIFEEWSDIKKALYVYDFLREDIIYHPRHENENSDSIRTLRGLLSKRTVCAGYALIYKEVMDRLGIKCDYVEGATTKSGAMKGITSHAWNIINIYGMDFPIDLTWDAGRYRQGCKDSFNYFSNVLEFRKSHFPSDLERVINYNNLYGVKSDFVKSTIGSFQRKKDYTESVFQIRTDDGSVVYIAQVGQISDSLSAKKMYRYALARKNQDNQLCDYKMVYSPTNFLNVNFYLSNRKIDKNHFMVEGIRKLFSSSNIEDSLKRGTNYIGKVSKDHDGKPVIVKDFNVDKIYPVNYKEMVRNNGEHFLIGEACHKVVDKNNLYFGYVSSFSSDEKSFREYKVISDKSLLDDDRKMYVDDFLSESRLDRKVKEAGGYLGYYSESGIRTYNPKFSQLFDIRSKGDITKSDIIRPEEIFNNNSVGSIDFFKVKDYAYNYDVKFDNATGEYEIFDKQTKKIVHDDVIKKSSLFAHMWIGCAGVKSYSDEKISGESYAFNDGSNYVYDYLMKSCISSIENTGRINFKCLSGDDMLKKGYPNYKYNDLIIGNILNNEMSRKILHDYCNLQVSSYNNAEVQIQANQFNVDNRRDSLVEMFDDYQKNQLKDTMKTEKKL